MWCPVLPPPRTSWPGWRWVRPAVRRSRGRWPAGPAPDGGRRPGSDGAGADAAAEVLLRRLVSFVVFVLGAEYNILQ